VLQSAKGKALKASIGLLMKNRFSASRTITRLRLEALVFRRGLKRFGLPRSL
jgi:hypothetical protein